MKGTGTALIMLGVLGLGVALTVTAARGQGGISMPADPAVAAGDPQPFTASQVSASGSHTCALLPDGTLRCWGYNEYGQLGDGTTTNASTPVPVTSIATAAVAAGHHHTCALLADGTVWCWGRNEFGEVGDGAPCAAPPCETPLAVPVGGITATAVSPGAYHTCALLPDGAVRCWGDNTFGQLGNGTTVSSATPVAVSGLPPAAAVTAGAYHTCALLPDGAAWCWGRNDGGQLGDGASPDSSVPVAVSGLGPAAALSAGAYHTCARLPDSTLRCWGRNTFGQLGNGQSLTYPIGSDPQGTLGLYESTLLPGSHSRTPVEVAGISTATAVTAGGFHTCASLSDGSTSCWGQNDRGQLGDGTQSSKPTPVAVSGLAPSAAVTAGAWHTCALLPDGAVRCWGWNFAGQLGDGTTADSSTPVAVAGSGS